MIDMLRALEPRREEAGVMLHMELDEVNEVNFILNGTFEIGFEINRIPNYVLRFKNCNVIGAYGVTFNRRSMFLYKTVTTCHGFFIRRIEWRGLMEEHASISQHLKDAVKKEYEISIMNRVMTEKKAMIKKWKARSDYEATLQVVSNDRDCAPGLFKHPAEQLKEAEELVLEPEIPDLMEEYELRFRLYESTIRSLLHTNDDMYEKLIQAEIRAQEQEERILQLQINNDILSAAHDQKVYANSKVK